MKTKILGLLMAGGLAGSMGAQAEVITFGSLTGDAFSSYTEAGLTVSKISGSGCASTGFGNPAPSVFGGPVCDTGTTGVFTISGSNPFVFQSIDLAANNGDLSYSIEGILGGSTAWTQSASLAGSGIPFPFSTILSSYGSYVDSMRLSFRTAGTSWNFDNIRFAPYAAVPEPGTLALLGLGLAGLGLSRRRKAN